MTSRMLARMCETGRFRAVESAYLMERATQRARKQLAALKARGFHVRGPLSADTLFHEEARKTYDAALCMYHDQALIPIKTIDFAGGVNVTLGLPFVRTSPDHGTAFDIAGSGRADPSSFAAAARLARSLVDGAVSAASASRARPAASSPAASRAP